MNRKLVALVLGLLLLVPGVAAATDDAQGPLVNINAASVERLKSLPGIGDSKALAIVKYRQRRLFRRTTELLRIRGIGRRLFARLRPLVEAGPPQGAVTGQ